MITLHRSWIIDYRAVTVDFCDNINSLQTAVSTARTWQQNVHVTIRQIQSLAIKTK